MMETIGSRIKGLRKSKHLTQGELAKRIGIKQPSLSLIESGGTVTIAGTTLAALCSELTTTPSFIMLGVEDGDAHETAMQEAELIAIFRALPRQAQDALIHSARTVKEALSTSSAWVKPVKNAPPVELGGSAQKPARRTGGH
jgi:transcriptional regulator with XRE-family HTH domain